MVGGGQGVFLSEEVPGRRMAAAAPPVQMPAPSRCPRGASPASVSLLETPDVTGRQCLPSPAVNVLQVSKLPLLRTALRFLIALHNEPVLKSNTFSILKGI